MRFLRPLLTAVLLAAAGAPSFAADKTDRKTNQVNVHVQPLGAGGAGTRIVEKTGKNLDRDKAVRLAGDVGALAFKHFEKAFNNKQKQAMRDAFTGAKSYLRGLGPKMVGGSKSFPFDKYRVDVEVRGWYPAEK